MVYRRGIPAPDLRLIPRASEFGLQTPDSLLLAQN